MSPPRVGAWIETYTSVYYVTCYCRPPAWGRGLKLFFLYICAVSKLSPPRVGAWIETPSVPSDYLASGVAPPRGGVD